MVGFFRDVTNHMDEEVSDGLVGIRCNDSVSPFINLHLAKNKGGVSPFEKTRFSKLSRSSRVLSKLKLSQGLACSSKQRT